MAVNDVYEAQQKYRDHDGKLLQTTMFYRQQSDGVGGPYPTQAERLARDWMLDVWPTILPRFPNSWALTGMAVKNLFNPSDAFELPLSVIGGRTTAGQEMLPTFVAGVATLAHSNAAVKKGRKSLSGLFEADQNGGTLTTGGQTNFGAWASAFLIGVSTIVGGARAFMPVVVKRIKYTTDEGNEAYRLPELLSELVYGSVVSSVLSLIVSTQNSRKR